MWVTNTTTNTILVWEGKLTQMIDKDEIFRGERPGHNFDQKEIIFFKRAHTL